MTKSQTETMEQMKTDRWEFLAEFEVTMNNRNHKVVQMKRDGKIVLINSRGGFKGVATILAKQ